MHVGCKMYFKMTAGSYKTSIGLRQEERQRKLFVLSDLLFTELSASVSQYSRLHFATPPYFLFFGQYYAHLSSHLISLQPHG